jgi:hypothetical protein
MTQEVMIAGSPCTAKVRDPLTVAVLSVLTLGVYSLFWWYAINREMRDLGHARAAGGLGERPEMSALAFSGLSVFTVYVALVWTIVTTTRRVRRSQRLTGQPASLNGWISAGLWIFTLGIGGVIYTQHELNKVWATQEASVRDQEAQGIAPSTATPPAPAAMLRIEDPEEWPAEHPALWDPTTRRAYKKRYGKPPGV